MILRGTLQRVPCGNCEKLRTESGFFCWNVVAYAKRRASFLLLRNTRVQEWLFLREVAIRCFHANFGVSADEADGLQRGSMIQTFDAAAESLPSYRC